MNFREKKLSLYSDVSEICTTIICQIQIKFLCLTFTMQNYKPTCKYF